MDNHIYDVIIIGGGPAGYTSALYTARAGFDTLVIEKFSAGGQMTQTSQIDNYPGFDEGVDGFTLGFKMQNGAERFGTKTIQSEVLSVQLKDKIKTVVTADGTFRSKTVIIATGADHKHLGLKNEENLIGKGVGYCAACDGMFYKDKTVAVVGGGNSAAADALLLSKICKKVFLIHRRDTLKATKVYHEPLMKTENVEFIWNSIVDEILYDETVNGVKIKNIKNNSESKINCDGLFISIGRSPETALFKGQIDIDEFGYIKADESTKTNIEGVFAVGDVRTKVVRQIVTAVADGATSSHFIEQYLAHVKGE
ncbi:MAG: thioredoxin-disulfide reductase [Clostridia bacterium]|nr:thioredoxin-disulfide reductase [Clostridia bacterium]